MEEPVLLKPYTLRELALIYGVSVKVVKTWLKDTEPYTGEKRGRFYTARQVALIFRLLGLPHKVVGDGQA
jgi:hypothetical protein